MTKAANFADYGLGVGIQSAGSVISGVGVTQLNFIGTGNTFRVSGGTVDISISAGAGSTQWITNNTGIVTTSKVAIGTDNARYQLEVSNSGVAGTALWVTGDARITGILSIGTGTITIDGSNNTVNIGTGVTIDANSGIITASIINTRTLDVSNKTIGIGSTSTPSDSLADGSGIVVYGNTNKTLLYDNTRKGWDSNVPVTTDEIRFYSVAEKHVVAPSGTTVNLVYNGSSANIGLATDPTANLTLNVTGIPTSSDFDNHTLSFTVFVNQTGTARSCTAVNLNGFPVTIRWSGGSLAEATAGVTTSNGMDIYSFTGINTIGSASTTANYYVLGSVSGGYR